MTSQSSKIKFDVLVIGAGLAGMTAAHHLAEWGARTLLVDKAPHIGGAFLLLDHTFTTDSCGLCIALPRQPSYCPTIASELHPRITSLSRTTLATLEGGPGDFVAALRREPRYVDPTLCDNCGACAAVCPVTRPRSASLADPRSDRAIYPPPPRAVPFAYALDPEACTRCGACVEVCPRGAINLEALGRVSPGTKERVEIGAAILAPGFSPFDAARAVEYGWGRCANVVTSLEFERMLNRSGPTGGRLLRPSDGQPPRRVAFIHCVGSRSEALGRPYCSTSCCMITAKQVGLTKDVAPETDVTVFTMDVRTPGKGYERYFQRVTARPGVTYRRDRPAAVHGIAGSQNLRLLTSDGEPEFDLVVLAVGMGPAESVRDLAGRAGVALDEFGFILPGDGGPGSTSRPGVFVAGSGLAPADLPETVTQAAAAASLAATGLHIPSPDVEREEGEGRGASPTISMSRSGDPSHNQGGEGVSDRPPSIGLFLCTCHGALDGYLDFDALTAVGEGLRGVSHVERLEAACEESGLAAIEHAAAEYDLNRIVVAGCSPHLYADRFDALMERLGLPSGPKGRLLARANVREGAAWVHRGDVAAATAVARGELTMAVAGLRETPYRSFDVRLQEDVARRVLVLGGGLSGMAAALTLADLGIDCHLVERETELGGNLRESLRTLDGLDAQALLSETVARVRGADRVRVWTEAELAAWSGVKGDFTAEIRLGGGTHRERYGALIVATGAEAATTTAYLYGRHPRVVTQRELERMVAGSKMQDARCRMEDARRRMQDAGLLLPDSSFLPLPSCRSVVMIQCVGSRDDEHPYCSRVCCAHAIKNALALKELDPSMEVNVLFRDVRTMGTRELYYREARRRGVRFLRYEPPERPAVEPLADDRPRPEFTLSAVEGPVEGIRVTVHDTLYDETVALEADLLVLSTGIVPSEGPNRRLAEMVGVPLDEDGFFAEAHPKLRPTDFLHPGIFLCGLAYGPRFITESVAQARAAALRAALAVSEDDPARPAGPRRDVAIVERKLCSFCGLCVNACPYGARFLDEEDRFARVIDHLCQGCGTCVAVCPNGASRQPAFEAVQALAMVDAALSE